MHELAQRLLEAGIQTAALFWPLLLAFIAAIAAILSHFLKACAQDLAHRRSAADSTSPQPSIYDQESEPAWMPSSPEAWLEYREFNYRRWKRRRAA